MLYIIGLGLGDERDITLRGLEAVKKSQKVYMEAYTSLLSFGLSPNGLSNLVRSSKSPSFLILYIPNFDPTFFFVSSGKVLWETNHSDMIEEAVHSDVSFLVVGDPFAYELQRTAIFLFELKKLGVNVEVLHNASVMNTVGICGLQLYHYEETVSIPFFTETWRPDSFYEKIKKSRSLGLHTLCLLDIRVKEPTFESLCRGGNNKQYEPPRYMTVNTAIKQLLEVEKRHGNCVYDEDTECVGFARLGSEDQKIIAGSMKQLVNVDFGEPLHCLVIVGETHPVEEEMLEFYKYKTAN